MASRTPGHHILLDFFRTLILWGYFTLGFVTGFLPLYLMARLFASDRQAAFQKLNHRFFEIFFRLVRRVIPGVVFRISPEVRALRGSVIVCNHRSYLDPILLISLFEKQKTIVKSFFFKVPMFSWVLQISGYIPSSAKGVLAFQMLEQVESMGQFLAEGGNLFVFPEGTRGAGAKIGKLEKGAFRIARRCDSPIEVIYLENTERLFPPNRFLFNTCGPPAVSLRHIGRIMPGKAAADFADQMAQVRNMYERQACQDSPIKV